MFSTWDRNPAAGGRWFSEADRSRQHIDDMGSFLSSIDVMIYLAGAAFAACLIAIMV